MRPRIKRESVLILVVMEDGLRAVKDALMFYRELVLILVVMEDGLRDRIIL